MAQVKIYALREHLQTCRQALSDAIQDSLVEALGLPVDKRFQRFLALEREDFIYPPDRSARYLIIEISMFEGRSSQAKRDLIHALFRHIGQRCGIDGQDIEITIVETPRENWGIRGQHGSELALNYRIEV